MIRWFDEVSRTSAPYVGGKGANLGELTQAGFPVPWGFIITVEAYKAGLAKAHGAICDAYSQLTAAELVAVRSSAPAEDGGRASFAGQHHTRLNVKGEVEVIQSVVDCWESLYADAAVAYRKAMGVSDEGLTMAVVVQIMVNAVISGTMFTKDVVEDDHNYFTIEATPGYGDVLVSGEVNPDLYIIEKQSLETAIKPKEPILSDWHLSQLCALGHAIEAHYESPQDVEWAMDSQKIYICQSRPITA